MFLLSTCVRLSLRARGQGNSVPCRAVCFSLSKHGLYGTLRCWTARAQPFLRCSSRIQHGLVIGGGSMGIVVALGMKYNRFLARCDVDLNNNFYLTQEKSLKEPEFKWTLLWKFLKSEILPLILAIILAFGAAVVNIHVPLMLGDLVNVVSRFVHHSPMDCLVEMGRPALCLLAMYGCQGLLTIGYIMLLSQVGERVAASMRKSLFDALIRQDIAFFDATCTGHLVSRLTADVQEFKSSFKLVISQGLRSATQIVGCVTSLCMISPKLTAAMITVMTALVSSGALIGSFLRDLSRQSQQQIARATGVADESLMNVRTVRAFAMEDVESTSMANLSVLFGQVVRGLSAGSRVFEFMDLTPSIPVQGGLTIPFHSLLGHVQFHNVSFSYPTRPTDVVLQDLNLTLPPCKVVALVGLSGGGKSTVAALLERFYNPTQGVITLDGKDLQTLDPAWLRRSVIGLIDQEPMLFATTIIENIRFGKPGATDEEVFAVAKVANADDFIRGFPDGYQTIVGERGIALSGGQKQRLAIARALLKDPTVLIMDEATSALDAQAEKAVQTALDQAAHGRTVLLIAHRLSTIVNADIIYVLVKGKIHEVGTHADLLKKRGLYAELIRWQNLQHK
uniref:mitochondrial potassium channel ATP-binding subunit isoform X2 n=1 Tax=Myxine glutinosa TaxID=7769 RepID=UPI0035900832